MAFAIPFLFGVALGATWMVIDWDKRPSMLYRTVNWLLLIGLFFDGLWLFGVLTGVQIRTLAGIGVFLLLMGWTIIGDWRKRSRE